MKTKIIYISGNEIFDMHDVRAAFEEVRRVLSLGDDTVLFGVPVDSDDAFATKTPAADIIPSESDDTPVEIAADIIPEITPEPVEITPELGDTEPDIESQPENEIIPEPAVENDSDIEIDIVPEIEETDSVEITTPETADDAEPDSVVPILSILASGTASDDETQDTQNEEIIDESEFVDVEPDYDEPQVAPEYDEPQTISVDADDDDAPINIVVETTTITEQDDMGDITTIEKTTVSVDDFITNEVPSEKTIEDLLESTSPLYADFDENGEIPADTDTTEVPDVAPPDANTTDPDDATLEKLATEMVSQLAETTPAPKSTTTVQKQGRLGKFKNVIGLSSKRSSGDSGFMADLFGWAGVAANDDSFAMPDFFPTKK